MSLSFYDYSINVYSAARRFVSKCAKPQTMDRIQWKILSTEGTALLKAGIVCGATLACLGCPLLGLCAGISGYVFSAEKPKTIRFMFDSTNKEIERIVQRSKQNLGLPAMLAVRSTFDINGALCSQMEIARYEQFAKTCRIDLVQGKTKADFESQIAQLQDKYDIVLCNVHSEPDACFLSETLRFSKTSKKMIEWLKNKTKENGIIILQGCYTGYGDDCIAKAISKECPNVTVYGSNASLSNYGIQYDDRCIPTFVSPEEIEWVSDGSKFVPRLKNITRKFIDGAAG